MVLGHRAAAQVAARRRRRVGDGRRRAGRRLPARDPPQAGHDLGAQRAAVAARVTAPAPPSPSCPPARAAAPARAGPRSEPSARPARGRSKPRPQRAQVRISPLSVASPRLASQPGARAAIGQQRAVDVGDDELGAAQRHRPQLAGRDLAGRVERHPRRRRGGRGRVAVGHLDLQQPGRRPGALAGARRRPRPRGPARSGAASSIASLIASSSVAADAGQPLQWPSRRSRATPSSMPSSSTSPPWDSM